MAYRRKTTRKPVRRRAVSRRRRGMGQAFSAASLRAASMTAVNGALGGAAAAVLTNVVGDNLGTFKPYTGLVGALATSIFFKRPEIAAGMAGYSGAKVASELIGSETTIGKLFAAAYEGGSNYYLQGYDVPMMGGSNIYASDYTLSENFVPGL